MYMEDDVGVYARTFAAPLSLSASGIKLSVARSSNSDSISAVECYLARPHDAKKENGSIAIDIYAFA